MGMQNLKVNWYKNRNHSRQVIIQSISKGLQFAFLTDSNDQCDPFVFCRDLLQGYVKTAIHREKSKIYTPCLTRTRLLVTDNSFDIESRIPGCLDFIHQIENELKIRPTKTIKCKKIGFSVFAFEASRRWIKSPPMLSMYTLLIRVGMSHTKGCFWRETVESIVCGKKSPYVAQDKNRLKYGVDGIYKILKHGDRNIFHRQIELNYPKKEKLGTIHSFLGIVGFSTKQSKEYMPHWHRMD
jgi:hypothetical protein